MIVAITDSMKKGSSMAGVRLDPYAGFISGVVASSFAAAISVASSPGWLALRIAYISLLRGDAGVDVSKVASPRQCVRLAARALLLAASS